MQAESINRGTLACSRHTADTDAHRVAGIGQALLDNLLGYDLMLGKQTLHECHGTRQHSDVALHDALHILGRSEQALALLGLHIGIYNRGLLYACIYGQALVYIFVFGVLHGY